MSQLSFASLDYATKKKRTRREAFLAEMDEVVPWARLEAVIAPHYPKAGLHGGRRPYPMTVMLRIYLLQQWYQLSDPGAEEALYDIQSMRAFAGLELGRDAIPDETTILNFQLAPHPIAEAPARQQSRGYTEPGPMRASRKSRGRRRTRASSNTSAPSAGPRSRPTRLPGARRPWAATCSRPASPSTRSRRRNGCWHAAMR